MSAAAAEEKSDDTMSLCACCGTAGDDGIKLKKCTACYLVKYCSVKCQKDHRPKHKKACKKRAAELRDEILFKQPESSYPGDCPICCLPISTDLQKSSLYSCCCKRICNGCEHANAKREEEGRLQEQCPYCRSPVASMEEEHNMNYMKRVEANDPVAMTQMGAKRYHEGDYNAAFEYNSKAAALGNVNAHFNLSCLYHLGEGFEKNEKKRVYHLEEAAIGGHAIARYKLGHFEADKKRHERAIKHWIIAANMGHDDSLEMVKEAFKMGLISKEYFAAVLRAHRAAVDAMISPQREEAKYYKKSSE